MLNRGPPSFHHENDRDWRQPLRRIVKCNGRSLKKADGWRLAAGGWRLAAGGWAARG
jgi:hypothetical protein